MAVAMSEREQTAGYLRLSRALRYGTSFMRALSASDCGESTELSLMAGGRGVLIGRQSSMSNFCKTSPRYFACTR